MWNTTQFGIHAGSDVYSHSVFTKAQSPNVTTLSFDCGAPSGSVLRAEGPLRYLSQVLHDRSCERDQFGTEMNSYEAKLFFFNCNLYSLQNAAWNLMFVLWNTVILWLMTKGHRMFFDESVATIFVFWPILKTSGQHRSQPDDTQISCCILHSEALSILLSRFQALKMILSVEVFEERNRCLTMYTERPWQDMSSRFVLLSGVKLIPKYVILANPFAKLVQKGIRYVLNTSYVTNFFFFISS